MSRFLAFAVAVSCCLWNASSAGAAFIFGVESSTPSTITAGTSGTITVFIDNTGAPTSVDTYQTALNIGATGATFAQLGLGSVTMLAPFDGTLDTAITANAPQFVFGTSLVFNAPSSISLASGRTNLYTLPFAVSNLAPSGSYTFDIVAGNASGATDLFFLGNSLAPTFAGTEFTLNISPVPEPATLGLGVLGVALAGPAVRKWRNRKRAA